MARRLRELKIARSSQVFRRWRSLFLSLSRTVSKVFVKRDKMFLEKMLTYGSPTFFMIESIK